MATLVSDIILDARALLDSYTEDGTVIAAGELLDFTASCIRFADMGQKELYKVGRFEKTIELSHYPVKNELGLMSNFNMVEFLGTAQYYPNEDGLDDIKSYYVEADRTHSVIVQELESGSWVDLVTNSGVATDMTAYKGNLTPTTAGNKIRFKMSGTTYYRHRNRALFAVEFEDDDGVPEYNPWVLQTLPDDFKSLDMVIKEYPVRQYDQSASYKFEKPNRLYFNYYFDGMIRIIYKPIPTTITADTQTLEVDDIVAKALAFYVASWVSPYENQSMTNPLFQKFLELKIEASEVEPVTEEQILNFYGGFANANI